MFALSRLILTKCLDQTHHPLRLRLNWVQLRVSSQYSYLLESRVVVMMIIQSDNSSELGIHLPPALSVMKQLNKSNLCGLVAGMASLAQRFLFNNQMDL